MPVKINNSNISNNPASNSGVKTASSSSASQASATSFQSLMKTARLDSFSGTMRELLEIVKTRGEDFLNSPQENSLNSYRESVKYFLKRLKEEFISLKDEFGAKREGEQKVYQLIDTAGGQADALSKEAFGKDKALELLSSLDDIRGLVLDVIG